MKYRPFTPDDLLLFPQTWREWRAADLARGVLPYPDLAPERINAILLQQMAQNPGWHAVVAIPRAHSRHLKGFCGGRLVLEPFAPERRAVVDLLAVDPKFQGQQIERGLIIRFWTWAQEHGATVLEAGYQPGTVAADLWVSAGMRPYLVRAAWVDAEGQPRSETPFGAPLACVEKTA